MNLDILKGKSLLVTGGTGSFGNAFVRRMLEQSKLRRLIIFSRDELKQHEMELAFKNYANSDMLRFFLGDVRDYERLKQAFHDVDYVVHAAALKQVPKAEYNPFEFIRTNINGAENIARAALEKDVKGVVALSTDKACAPINLYGATKLVSDKIFTAAQNFAGTDTTRFSVVRYGNVMGSRGSVIPFFQKLIDENAPFLPITDARMTRFWIRLDQGVDLVLHALLNMHGGEIFVPRIPSMKVTDLATALAPHIPQKIVGIRPGEKLHEVMITEEDSRNTLECEDTYIILPSYLNPLDPQYKKLNAKPVTEGFSYASDTNKDWLSTDALRDLLQADQHITHSMRAGAKH